MEAWIKLAKRAAHTGITLQAAVKLVSVIDARKVGGCGMFVSSLDMGMAMHKTISI